MPEKTIEVTRVHLIKHPRLKLYHKDRATVERLYFSEKLKGWCILEQVRMPVDKWNNLITI